MNHVLMIAFSIFISTAQAQSIGSNNNDLPPSPLTVGAEAAETPVRNVSEYNLVDGIGLKGYDPVSYFDEGGGEPLVGLLSLELNHEGVVYRFANQENLDLFITNPSKYEPTYGGYCAYAMAFGSKVDIQPKLFTINGNRLHFFVSKRAKQNFDDDIKGFENEADTFWKQISGEEARK